jgi:hypothetical protein
MRSLAKEPDARFQSADEFMHALPDVPAPSAAPPRVEPSSTVALEYSPAMSGDSVTRKPSGTMVFEYGSTRRDPTGSMAFDYSAGTLRRASYLRGPAPSPAATASAPLAANVAAAGTQVTTRADNLTRSSRTPTPAAQGARGALPGVMPFLLAHREAVAAVLVATLLLGALIRYAERPHATPRSALLAEPAAPPAVPSPAAEPAATPSADLSAATVVPAAAPPPATTGPDLSGTWRGAYVDASGKQLLRVVNLSINRVDDDGGIEGTLQYQAASGDGECKLRPRGSNYRAGERRLQLSPEGCSPHYPKELGVPLDFAGVNPRANTLEDGRIEAPAGELIRVKLKRVSGT